MLLRPALRTIRWVPLVLLTPVCFVIVYAGQHDNGDPGDFHLPLAGVVLAVWMGFVLGDPAVQTVEAQPTSLVVRRAVRCAVSLPAIAAVWVGLCSYAHVGWRSAPLTVALASQLLVAVAFAAVGMRAIGDELGGRVAAAGLFLVFYIAPLSLRIPLPLEPATDSWNHLYGSWIAVAFAGLLAFLAASSDPGRRGPVGWVRGVLARAPAVVHQAAP